MRNSEEGLGRPRYRRGTERGGGGGGGGTMLPA